jgi:serine/threonine protein kinase/tetratricopeptide (TPR) repeat protein
MAIFLTCPQGHRWSIPDGQEVLGGGGRPVTCPVCKAPVQLPQDDSSLEQTRPPEGPSVISALSGYEILAELGRGGMGIVYRARDLKRQTEVALKTMQWAEPAALYRFKQEFRALAGISHPNLVALHELVSDGRIWFFTMELVEGTTFLKYVRAAESTEPVEEPPTSILGTDVGGAAEITLVQPPREKSRVRVDRVRRGIRQLVSGVRALHDAGKLHRDIKPGNVLVTPQERVVLLDFGLAAELGRDGLHQSTERHVLGTVAYMAPEQAAGDAVGPAGDWYSVGVMLYQALTGRLPFEGPATKVLLAKQQGDGPPPSRFNADVPEDLDLLTAELLRRDPDARPPGIDILRRLAPGDEPVAVVEELPIAVPGKVELVGRADHLRALREALESVRQGQAVVLRVHGESGVGKSTLIRAFLDELGERHSAVVLAGQCYEQEAVPYKALDSVVDALTRHLLHLSAVEAAAVVPRDAAALARVFPVLRRVETIARAPQRGGELSDPLEERRRALAALRELLGRLGDRHPVVVFIDDLQWGDVDSAALLADLVRPPDAPALLLLMGYRSEDAASSPCLRALDSVGGGELVIKPLTPAQGRELVLALLPDASAHLRTQAEAIVHEASGNPFFLHELVQHLLAGAPDAGTAHAEEGEITLDQVLRQRLQRLAEPARRLLEVVAVAGGPVRQETACRAAGLHGEDLATLAHLRSARLIRSTGWAADAGEIETYHDRIREIIARNLSAPELVEHHRALVRVLQEAGGCDPEKLAVHLQGAGELRRAARYHARAADQAAQALAFERAAKLYRLALQLRQQGGGSVSGGSVSGGSVSGGSVSGGSVSGGSVSGGAVEKPVADASGSPPATFSERSLRTRLGDALANAGRGGESAEEYLKAADGASPEEGLELRRRAALQLLISGHVDDGLATLTEVLRAVGMALPKTPRRAFWALVLRRIQLYFRGLGFRPRSAGEVPPREMTRIDICWSAAAGLSMVDTIQGAYFQTRGLLFALAAGEPYHLARALAVEAAHISIGGSRSRTRTAHLLEAAEGLARQVDHPYPRGMVELTRGIVAAFEGNWRDALHRCEQAEEVFRSSCTGVVWELDTAQRFGSWALMYLGEIPRLARRLPILLKEAHERDDLYAVLNLTLVVGTFAHLAADEPDKARTAVEEVMQRWSRQGFHVQHLNRLTDEVQIDLYLGNGQAAWDQLSTNWPTLTGSHFFRVQQVRVVLWNLRGRAALARGLLPEAEQAARRLLLEKAAWADALAHLLQAGVEQARGSGKAAALLQEAIAGLDAVEMGLHAAAARRALGRMLRGEEGKKLIELAEAWMSERGIRNPARMAELLASSGDGNV